jgi:energy-converting hydrogenase Eha subunit G
VKSSSFATLKRIASPGTASDGFPYLLLSRVKSLVARRWDGFAMIKFLLWCLLFVFCWPLALAALVLYPLVWLFLLPFRIVGIAVEGVLQLVAGIIFLPARLLRAV